jgi:DNA (cytosine-5)-methyltransferase 1
VLFQEYVRLLHELEPEGFLFENVYGIVGAQGGEPWRLIVEGFQEAGFELSYRILDSADYGVPQHRERLFIVGRRSGTFDFPRPTHGPDSGVRPHVSALDAIADLAGERSDGASHVGGRFGSLLEEIPPGLNYAYFTEKMGHPRPVFAWRSKFSDFLYKADPDFPVRTIKARGGQYTGPFHWENRPFSTHELQRLQTFPDEYMLVGNRSTRIEQIGNSVPPQMARMLALSVRDQVFDLETPVRLPLLSPQEQLSFRSLKRQRTELYERKAQAAIAKLDAPKKRARSRRQTYRADLSAAFALEARADGDLLVDISTADEWVISVATEDVRNGGFEIELIPASLGWLIPADRVVLRGHLHPRSFTATWKAFERVLGEREMKADLVQLNGYYQYEPSINAKMTYDHSDPIWHVVSSVVAGHGVRAPSSGETLAFTWGVSADSIAGHCQSLRDLAYEVRNSNTNPQIPAGTWLIPYAFPTLNPKSVQLTKSLGPTAVDD